MTTIFAVETMCNGNNTAAVAAKDPPALVPGRSPEGVPIINSLRPQQGEEKVIIGIRGKWYDVTTFVPHHPGGDVLLEFFNKDATAQFMAYHSPEILKHRKPIGTYEFNSSAPGGSKLQGDWMALSDRYEEENMFQTPISFVVSRFVIQGAFLAGALACTYLYNTKQTARYSWMVLVVGAVCLAGFWQQSGEYYYAVIINIQKHATVLTLIISLYRVPHARYPA